METNVSETGIRSRIVRSASAEWFDGFVADNNPNRSSLPFCGALCCMPSSAGRSGPRWRHKSATGHPLRYRRTSVQPFLIHRLDQLGSGGRHRGYRGAGFVPVCGVCRSTSVPGGLPAWGVALSALGRRRSSPSPERTSVQSLNSRNCTTASSHQRRADRRYWWRWRLQTPTRRLRWRPHPKHGRLLAVDHEAAVSD